MPSQKLLKQTWIILRHTRLIWWLAIASVLATQFDVWIPSKSPQILAYCGLGIISLILGLLPFAIDGGMARIVSLRLNDQPIFLSEVWKSIRHRIGGLTLFLCLFIVVVLFLFVLFTVIFFGLFLTLIYPVFQSIPSKENILSALFLNFLITATLSTPILYFGTRAVYLEQKSAFSSLHRGITLYLKGFGQVFWINILYSVLTVFSRMFVSFLYLFFFNKNVINGFGRLPLYQQFMSLSSTGAAQITGTCLYLIAVPYFSILLTLIYMDLLENEKQNEDPQQAPSYMKFLQHYRRRMS